MRISPTSRIISDNQKHYPVRSLSLPFDGRRGTKDRLSYNSPFRKAIPAHTLTHDIEDARTSRVEASSRKVDASSLVK